MPNPTDLKSFLVFGTLVDTPSPTELRIREHQLCVVDVEGTISSIKNSKEDEAEAQAKESGLKLVRLNAKDVLFPGLVDCVCFPPLKIFSLISH
jgi:hypothetical protein